jgi:hypothetical protein
MENLEFEFELNLYKSTSLPLPTELYLWDQRYFILTNNNVSTMLATKW